MDTNDKPRRGHSKPLIIRFLYGALLCLLIPVFALLFAFPIFALAIGASTSAASRVLLSFSMLGLVACTTAYFRRMKGFEKYMLILLYANFAVVTAWLSMISTKYDDMGLGERMIIWGIVIGIASYLLYKITSAYLRRSKPLIDDKDKMRCFKAGEQLTSNMIEALHREGFKAEPNPSNDFKVIPEFNWNVRSFDHDAVLYLTGEILEILHVVALRENDHIHFQTKGLVCCPATILDGRTRRDEAFPVSYKAEER
jgi:hypothetical protein